MKIEIHAIHKTPWTDVEKITMEGAKEPAEVPIGGYGPAISATFHTGWGSFTNYICDPMVQAQQKVKDGKTTKTVIVDEPLNLGDDKAVIAYLKEYATQNYGPPPAPKSAHKLAGRTITL